MIVSTGYTGSDRRGEGRIFYYVQSCYNSPYLSYQSIDQSIYLYYCDDRDRNYYTDRMFSEIQSSQDQRQLCVLDSLARCERSLYRLPDCQCKLDRMD